MSVSASASASGNTSGSHYTKQNTDDLTEMREIFSLVDKDGGGTISTEELGELLELIGVEASKDDLENMIEQMDADNSGEIDFDEFAEVMTRRVDCGHSSDEIKEAFDLIRFDCDSESDSHGGINMCTRTSSETSKVRTEDIVKFLTKYGTEDDFPEERVRSLVSVLETDQDDYVDYAEYVEMMMNW